MNQMIEIPPLPLFNGGRRCLAAACLARTPVPAGGGSPFRKEGTRGIFAKLNDIGIKAAIHNSRESFVSCRHRKMARSTWSRQKSRETPTTSRITMQDMTRSMRK